MMPRELLRLGRDIATDRADKGTVTPTGRAIAYPPRKTTGLRAVERRHRPAYYDGHGRQHESTLMPAVIQNPIRRVLAVALSAASLMACGPTLAQQALLERCADNASAYDLRRAACSDYASDDNNPVEARSLALALLAFAAVDAGKNADAYLNADLALKLFPHNWMAMAARGWSHMGLGRFEEARGDFYDAGRYDSERARLQSNLGLSALAWEFDSFVLTRQLASDVLKVDPGHGHALYLSGAAAAALGDFEAGFADANALIAAHPDSPDGYELKGLVHHSRALRDGHVGDYKLALTEYEQAESRSKQATAGLLRRHAWLLATGPTAVGNPQKALDLARRAMDKAKRGTGVPKHLALFHHTLAVALAVNGAVREAEIEFEAVMENFPGARSRIQKALAGAGYLTKGTSATLYELLGAIHACLNASCNALNVPLVYKTL